jgi:hypothetical protein
MESVLLDAAGHRRSPATLPGYHRGRPPRNKGEEYPADPPTVEEIVAVMRTIGDRAQGHRLRALIVLLWRAGLRISEALSLPGATPEPGDEQVRSYARVETALILARASSRDIVIGCVAPAAALTAPGGRRDRSRFTAAQRTLRWVVTKRGRSVT